MKDNFCELVLTCSDRKEAEKIADALLKKKLIACAKFLPIESVYRWKGKVENSKEVLMLMESRSNLFEQTESEVAKLHSYDTFVLKMLPIGALSEKAIDWLEKETNDD